MPPQDLNLGRWHENSEGKEIAMPINQVALVSSVLAIGTREKGERRFEDRRFPGKESKH